MTKLYDLNIRNGIVVTPNGKYQSDIGVKDGLIVALAKSIPPEEAEEEIDAAGLYILPGCIDSHMHLWEPGLVAAPDFRDGTRAALAGGISTIIDHPLTIPEVLNREIFADKITLGESTSFTDFALHGGVGVDNLFQLHGLWDAGCTAFKIFTCESGLKVAGLNSGQLLEVFREVGSFGGTVILHTENDEMLSTNRQRLEQAGRKDYMAFVDWRPPEAEVEAIHRCLFLLQGTGARAIFLHTTVPEGVEMVTKARQQGLDVWVETCPHNLYLTTKHLEEFGPWVTYSPPVRNPARVEALRKQLQVGLIATMGSDHGAVDPKLKEKGIANIWQGQFGVPGTETMVPLMLDAVAKGWLSLERLTAILSENPARLYGLYPHKGAIQIGSDADFTIVDLSVEKQLRATDLYTSCGWIPYEGWQVTGSVVSTIIRGVQAYKNGKILVEPGFGRFYRRAADLPSFLG